MYRRKNARTSRRKRWFCQAERQAYYERQANRSGHAVVFGGEGKLLSDPIAASFTKFGQEREEEDE